MLIRFSLLLLRVALRFLYALGFLVSLCLAPSFSILASFNFNRENEGDLRNIGWGNSISLRSSFPPFAFFSRYENKKHDENEKNKETKINQVDYRR